MSADRINAVVVGGGVVGCAAAYYLAKAGVGVTLLEKGALCSESSSANAGLASLSIRTGIEYSFGGESLRMIAGCSREFESDFEFEPVGSLVLLRTETEYRERSAFVERQRLKGVDIQLVDPKTAREIEPAIAPDVLGAVYSPLDCNLSPYGLTVAFAREARKLGATIRTGVEVTGLKAEGGRVRAAVAAGGQEVAGDFVVLAAGAWSPALSRTLSLDLPVEPGRGQIVVTEPVRPFSKRTVKNTGHIYIKGTQRGNYVIGSATEKVGFDKGHTAAKLREYMAEAEELLPPLKRTRVMRAWAGLRPLSPDGAPIMGPVEGYEGLILATGHSRSGVFFSAASGKLVADLVTTGATPFPLDKLGLARFKTAA